MTYLLIETKHPLDGGAWAFDLGKQLRAEHHDVTIFLLQDGVFAGRRGFPKATRLRKEAKAGGLALLADDLSLRERGLVGKRLADGITVRGMADLADLLMARTDKAIWH
jgi:sulfur relay (sulfurtransferase) complex TusBCD TusD component (DsrE family)